MWKLARQSCRDSVCSERISHNLFIFNDLLSFCVCIQFSCEALLSIYWILWWSLPAVLTIATVYGSQNQCWTCEWSVLLEELCRIEWNKHCKAWNPVLLYRTVCVIGYSSTKAGTACNCATGKCEARISDLQILEAGYNVSSNVIYSWNVQTTETAWLCHSSYYQGWV